jgi:hypothetical protein
MLGALLDQSRYRKPPEYSSYIDCEDQWMMSYVDKRVPGLVPVWLAYDTKLATTHMSVAKGELIAASISCCRLNIRTSVNQELDGVAWIASN